MAVITGLSGNEMYCLQRKGLQAGDLVVGNSVYSVGFVGGLGSGLRTFLGGEVAQITSIVHEGRQRSLERMTAEAQRHGGTGITGVSSELYFMGGNVEFISVGSCVHTEARASEQLAFSTSADGQELYCQLDAGFHPMRFVFGNCAYSVGVGGAIMGGLKSLTRGEVPHYSEVFNTTRHLALQRITDEARQAGANAVVGIRTSIIPFRGMQEMVMIGTASRHESIPAGTVITSDLTNQEMWNLVRIGFMPVQLVLGVSVYSLGLKGRLLSAFNGLRRGEIPELTHLIYEARENAISRIARDAAACGADDVAGIKTYIYELGGGMIELMAIGTAVKRMEGLRTSSEALPMQVVMKDKDTFINTVDASRTNLNATDKSGNSGFSLLKILLELIK